MDDIKVKPGPQYFEYSKGAIDNIPNILDEYNACNILIVHGNVSWEKAKPKFNFINKESDFNFEYYRYTGECSYYGTDLLLEAIKEKEIDFIIGVGGGKLSDLVGYSSHLSNIPFGIVPTLASNCAPWAPLSVMYKENGEAEGRTEHYDKQAAFLITDPYLVIDSPIPYFIAGLADTLAKWYESDLILSQERAKRDPFLKMARYASILCKDPILNNYKTAISNMEKQKVSIEFIELSEIIFGIAGLVGGLGGKYARNTAAHAMHDALSKYALESHNYLHGEKVAYGIFYQIALEERWELIPELLQFYEDLNLPVSLKSMGIDTDNDVLINEIIDFIYSKEKVHLIPVNITKEHLKETIFDLEEYIETKTGG